MKLLNYIKMFWKIPFLEKKLLLSAIGIIIIIIPLVQLIPLKHYINLLGNKPKLIKSNLQKKQYISLVRKTIRRTERIFQFRLSCLVKSLAFKCLLKTLGIHCNIGLGINFSQFHYLKAHAFVEVDEYIVFLKKQGYLKVYSLN
jgi:hypothetical protein